MENMRMSSKPLNNVIPVPAHPEEKGRLTEGLIPLIIALLIIVGWVTAFLTIGFAGLIVPALTLVAIIGGFIVWVSRG